MEQSPGWNGVELYHLSNDLSFGIVALKLIDFFLQLPATASYKMLHEKFTEFGDIHGFEEKGHGSVLITYGSDWQAERAIKNLDKARIDGRMIDARLFF